MSKRRVDYPLTLKVVDVAEIMRCSRAKVYDIIRRPDFPKLKEGRRIFIPRDGFFEWYRRQYGVSNDESAMTPAKNA